MEHGGAVQGSAQCGAPPPWQRDDGEVRRYGRLALIGAVAASIAGVGIGYPSFHNDPRARPSLHRLNLDRATTEALARLKGRTL